MVPAEVPIPIELEPEGRLSRYARRSTRLLDEEGKHPRHRQYEARELLSWISEFVQPSLVGPLHLPAFYLPADRTGIMHAHSVVVGALIANAPKAGIRHAAPLARLSGVLADFLEQLIEFDLIEVRHRKERDHGSPIEELIVDGSTRAVPSPLVGYPHFTYRPRGWKGDLPSANLLTLNSRPATSMR